MSTCPRQTTTLRIRHRVTRLLPKPATNAAAACRAASAAIDAAATAAAYVERKKILDERYRNCSYYNDPNRISSIIDPRMQPPLESQEWTAYHRLAAVVLDSKVWTDHGGPHNEEELRLGMTEDGRKEIRWQIAVAAAATALAASTTAAAPATSSSATGFATATRSGAPLTDQQRSTPEQTRPTSFSSLLPRMPIPTPPNTQERPAQTAASPPSTLRPAIPSSVNQGRSPSYSGITTHYPSTAEHDRYRRRAIAIRSTLRPRKTQEHA